jgi:hypothetical protein
VPVGYAQRDRVANCFRCEVTLLLPKSVHWLTNLRRYLGKRALKPIYYQNVTVNLAYFPMRLRDRCQVFARRGRQLRRHSAQDREPAARRHVCCGRALESGGGCRDAAALRPQMWSTVPEACGARRARRLDAGMQRRCLSSFRKKTCGRNGGEKMQDAFLSMRLHTIK